MLIPPHLASIPASCSCFISLMLFLSMSCVSGARWERQLSTVEASDMESWKRQLMVYSSETVPFQPPWWMASLEKNPPKCSSVLVNRQFLPEKWNCIKWYHKTSVSSSSDFQTGQHDIEKVPIPYWIDLSSDCSFLVFRLGITKGLVLFLEVSVHSKKMWGGCEKATHSLVNKYSPGVHCVTGTLLSSTIITHVWATENYSRIRVCVSLSYGKHSY